MTVIISGTDGITFPNSTEQASAGQVLQVVQSVYTTFQSMNSTTPTATGLAATITPKFSTSKILVMYVVPGCYTDNNNSAIRFNIYKNGSFAFKPDTISGYSLASINVTSSTQWLDSPASTSALTYALYWSKYGTGPVVMNNYTDASSSSTMTLLEIAG